MRILTILLAILFQVSSVMADWDMSGTKEYWNMIGVVKSIGIKTTLEQHQITTYDGKKVTLYFKIPETIDTIDRLPGKIHPWPHAGCLMCLHNHLVQVHRQSSDYLKRNGWGAWSTIHDNLHNDQTFKGKVGTGIYIGYNITVPKEASVFVPTPLDICEKMLEIAKIDNNDIVYDLGCGDGRILIMAALKYNCRAVGLDINPKYVKQTQKNIDLYGVGDLVRVYERDITNTKIPEASVVTLYLMPNLSGRIRPLLQNLLVGTRIIAHNKPIPQWKSDKNVKIISKADGYSHDIYLWKVIKQQRDKPECKT